MGIDISVVAGSDASSSSVQASGSVQHIITQQERDSFKLNDNQLKNAVLVYFGKRPNDAYLSSPTPWGDLYKTYGWPQVQTVLVVDKAEIMGLTSQPVIVKTQEFVNNSSQKGTFNVAISEQLSNTATTSWNMGASLTVTEKITAGIDFIAKGSAELSMSLTTSFGVGGSNSKTVTVGSNSGVTVELDPGESIIASLSASRGSLRVRIWYRAYLVGSTAVNYNPPYKDHHFWSLPISGVMQAGGLKNEIMTVQDIEIGYYSNSKIELSDKLTGKAISTHYF